MASLLAPSSNPPRISQVLPTVKCSSCSQPVPLSELGEHTCSEIPPVPVTPKLSPPSPLHSAKPLPARVTSPALPVAGPPPQRLATPPTRLLQSPQSYRVATPSNDRPRMSAGSVTPLPQRPSPLARQSNNDASISFQPPRDSHPQTTPPLKLIPPANAWPVDGRGRSISSASTQLPVTSFNSGLSHPGMSPSTPAPMSSPLARPSPIPAARSGGRVISFVPEDEVGIDTKTGGVAGMAGVGRRGFAAAVRAAMFVSPTGYPMDKHPNSPEFLDIDAASRSTDTPPLSAGSGYSSHSPGPLSPGLQTEFLPSPYEKSLCTPSPFQSVMSSSLPRLPSPVKSPVDEIATGSGLSPLDRLPFFGKYKNTLAGLGTRPNSFLEADGPKMQSNSDEKPRLRNLSVSTITSSDYKGGVDKSLYHDDSDSDRGLAYADSSDDEGGTESKGHTSSNKQPSPILRSDSTSTTKRVHFPDEANTGRSAALSQSLRISPINHDILNSLGSGHLRSGSDSSVDTRSVYSRTTSIGPISGPIGRGAFEHTMETLMEEVVIGQLPDVPSREEGVRNSRAESSFGVGSQPHRSNTVQVPPHSPENKPPKLPTRARTTNDSNKSLHEPLATRKEKVRRTRICLRCAKRIEDERWIKVDTGGALCEKCWKNMYLPKCRRCQLPIEKQAVSSADGQLKGKYHKACFDCHVCHTPFPDKSFYVYDGKPLCAYHYHEANDSLCAAARCGQPIEGPCAVSHTGDKYHPEHMTCEYPGSVPCDERLTEYWEFEGRMLCEKHAAGAGNGEDNDDGTQASKAKKRVTRFMNLAGGIGGTGGELDDLL